MNLYTAEKLRNADKKLIHYDIFVNLGALAVRAKTDIVRALRCGIYPAASGVGTTVYEELVKLAKLPGLQVRKSPHWGWGVHVYNPNPILHEALEKIWDLDVVSAALERATKRWGGGPNSGPYPYKHRSDYIYFSLCSKALKDVDHFRSFLEPVVADPNYQLVAQFLVNKVMSGKVVKFPAQ